MANTPPMRLLSCDAHLEHWPTVIKDYVPTKYRDVLDSAPLKVKIFGHVDLYGPNCTHFGIMAGRGDYQSFRPGNNDIREHNIPGAYGGPQEWLEWMDIDSVNATVLMPGTAIGASIGAVRGTGDRDGYLEFLRGYNNFLSDFCSYSPDRLLGAALIPVTGIEDAIAELKRVRNLPGIRTIGPGAFPNGSASPSLEDDAFWRVALDIDMPVTFHGGVSSPVYGLTSRFDAACWVMGGQLEATTGGPYSAAQLILSGVFDRNPDLRIIVLECGAGWLPYYMDTMNHFYGRHRHWAGIELKNLPSWYCTSGNLLWNVITDRTAIKLRNEIGIDNLSWSADFPHSNCNYPHSKTVAAELCADLTHEERDQVLWGNAAKFYRMG